MEFHLLASYVDYFHRDGTMFCSETLREKGVTVGLLYFILYVCKYPGCTIMQMSRDLGLDRAYVLRCVQKMVDEGFFERRPHPTDGRATVLYPNEKARELDAIGHQLLEDWDQRALTGITDAEKEELFHLLEKIRRKGEPSCPKNLCC